MEGNNLDERFIDHMKSAHVVVHRMAPQNMECNMAFLNTKEDNVHLPTFDETHVKSKLFVEELYSKINWNGFSEEFIEHVKSACVVVNRLKCKQCNAVFHSIQEYYIHLTSHVERMDSDVLNDQFVKRYECDKCDRKFVLESTLKMHMAFHDPFPHNCFCGIGFYLKSDLLMHKELVHPATFKEEFDKLTSRKQRALKNEYWGTAMDHNGPPKKERSPERSQPRGPRLKAELVVKSPKKMKTKKEKRLWKIQVKRGPVACQDCGKQFKYANSLDIHRRIHTGEKPYSCHLCDRKFSQPGSLKLHLERHAGVKNFACDVCGRQFHARSNMENHRRIHTGLKPYECSYCGKAFSDPSAHKRHERTHSGVKPYACAFCGMRFSDASGKIAHEKRHIALKKHSCHVCGKPFYNADEVRKHHIAVHTCEKKFQCDICSKCFALKNQLAVHIKHNHTGTAATFHCDHCHYKTTFKMNLVTHMRHHVKVSKQYRCADCGMRFYDRHPLERHRNAKHVRVDKYECDVCSARFTNKMNTYKHIVLCHMDIKCDDCTKRFCSRSELEKHKSVGCVQCDICRVKLPSYGRLNAHRVVHFEAKHECRICWRKYRSVAKLNKHHGLVHSTEEKFECHYCGDKFAVKCLLRSHIYREHLESRYCNLCIKPFYSDSELKRHKSKGCKGKRPVSCEICDKVFKSQATLRVHVLIKHAKMYVECDHCGSRFGGKCSLKRHIRSQHLI
ncbi:hypothetical protein evm_004902 [Chilo suppressalis]|nr:hypothetical protein evm_004902 [Chilo suppressalis]